MDLLLHTHIKTPHLYYSCSLRSSVWCCMAYLSSVGRKERERADQMSLSFYSPAHSNAEMPWSSILHVFILWFQTQMKYPWRCLSVGYGQQQEQQRLLQYFGIISLWFLGTVMTLPEQSAGYLLNQQDMEIISLSCTHLFLVICISAQISNSWQTLPNHKRPYLYLEFPDLPY